MDDLVSVVIPFYNGKLSDLQRAVQSVVDQTYSNVEVIICDDGSEQKLHERVDSMSSVNIRVTHHNSRKGIPAARNSAVALANGKWLVWLDCDDTLDKNCIEILMRYSKNKVLVVGECYVFENGKYHLRKPMVYGRLYNKYQGTVWDPFMLNVTSVQPELVLKEAFEEMGGFDEKFEFAEMTDFFLRFLANYGEEKIIFIRDAIYNYNRIYSNSVSSNREQLFKYRYLALRRYQCKQQINVNDIIYIDRTANTKMQSYIPIQDGKVIWPPYLSMKNGILLLEEECFDGKENSI